MSPMEKNFANGRRVLSEALELLADEVPVQNFSLEWLLDWHRRDEEEFHEYACREAGRRTYSE